MPSKSAIVFIDENNLYHNVKTYRCRPGDIDLNKLGYFITQKFLDVLGMTQKKEKGIDIIIAVHMIKKCMIDKECDCCILISGDADFIPAMEIIKKSGGEVITSMTPAGYSRELRSGAFRYYLIKRSDLVDCTKDFKEIKNQ